MKRRIGYKLEYDGPENDFEGVRLLFHMSGAGFIFDNGHDTCVSWYEYEELTLHKISANYPEFTFTLTGIGEEPGDMWKKRFRAGQIEKVRCAEIVWPEFEELT